MAFKKKLICELLAISITFSCLTACNAGNAQQQSPDKAVISSNFSNSALSATLETGTNEVKTQPEFNGYTDKTGVIHKPYNPVAYYYDEAANQVYWVEAATDSNTAQLMRWNQDPASLPVVMQRYKAEHSINSYKAFFFYSGETSGDPLKVVFNYDNNDSKNQDGDSAQLTYSQSYLFLPDDSPSEQLKQPDDIYATTPPSYVYTDEITPQQQQYISSQLAGEVIAKDAAKNPSSAFTYGDALAFIVPFAATMIASLAHSKAQQKEARKYFEELHTRLEEKASSLLYSAENITASNDYTRVDTNAAKNSERFIGSINEVYDSELNQPNPLDKFTYFILSHLEYLDRKLSRKTLEDSQQQAEKDLREKYTNDQSNNIAQNLTVKYFRRETSDTTYIEKLISYDDIGTDWNHLSPKHIDMPRVKIEFETTQSESLRKIFETAKIEFNPTKKNNSTKLYINIPYSDYAKFLKAYYEPVTKDLRRLDKLELNHPAIIIFSSLISALSGVSIYSRGTTHDCGNFLCTPIFVNRDSNQESATQLTAKAIIPNTVLKRISYLDKTTNQTKELYVAQMFSGTCAEVRQWLNIASDAPINSISDDGKPIVLSDVNNVLCVAK